MYLSFINNCFMRSELNVTHTKKWTAGAFGDHPIAFVSWWLLLCRVVTWPAVWCCPCTWWYWGPGGSLASSLKQMVLHRWCNVLMTPSLSCRDWVLDKLRYCSVCVGLRKMLKLSWPVGDRRICASSMAMVPPHSFSGVNWIAGWMELM